MSQKKQNFIPTLEYDFCLFNASNLIDYPLKILQGRLVVIAAVRTQQCYSHKAELRIPWIIHSIPSTKPGHTVYAE